MSIDDGSQGIDFSVELEFHRASHTAIVGDLHLCEAEPPNKRHPLWKKFKTKEFFFDHEFSVFLRHAQKSADGKSVELILNGDIFDFDSVTSFPETAHYNVSWLESRRGLDPEKEKSLYKIDVILRDHPEWVRGMSQFIKDDNKVVFIIGNHDLELNWLEVQKRILDAFSLTEGERRRVRFVEWFYISNKDTLVEHGHQYDPFCASKDPVNPVVVDYNRLMVRMPFGDLACRYLSNGMGFFNPHVDSNFLLTAWGFTKVYFKYMLRAQPALIWTGFWGSLVIFIQTIRYNTLEARQNALTIEDRIDEIAKKSNATPRMVREMQALFSQPIANSPLKIMRELWLDRAFMVLLALFLLLYLFLLIDKIYAISVYWLFSPIILLFPPYFLYARNVHSYVHQYKQPDEEKMAMAGMITGTRRSVFGHTHILRHEVIGGIEHLNHGTWSPAFQDVECTQKEGQNAFIWIAPSSSGTTREAKLFQVEGESIREGGSSPEKRNK
jgi:UDP-2,3-diacylglucosamine pyrophosphatase LpxH